MKIELLPLIVDRELDQEANDAFGHKHFSRLLQQIITDEVTTLPYSVGLLGGWGTGKSSITKLTQQRIEVFNKTSLKYVKCVTFNAWRFGGENLKRALLREVFLELDGSEDEILDHLNRYKVGDETVEISKKEFGRKIYEAWLTRPLLGLVIITVLIALLLLFPQSDVWKLVPSNILTVVSAALALWVLNLDKLFVSRLTSLWRLEPPRSSAEDFEVLLLKQFKKYQMKNPQTNRIVIFVDDLDRLSSDEMIQGLEAIRSFLELPRNKLSGIGVIFVVSCDENRIAEALKDRAMNLGDVADHNSQNNARRYLDRVFQYRLEIPPLPRADMRLYAKNMLEKHVPEYIKDFEANGDQLEDILERLIHTGVTNPRQALQLVNALLQAWWVAWIRENEGIGNSNAGFLKVGTVTKSPQSLAVICVLRVDFPDFYQKLESEPRLLEAFKQKYVLQNDNYDMPYDLENLLQSFTDPERVPSLLSNRFRALRSYLSSVQSVNILRLEPLLRLSEDAISRKFGDNAGLIRDALVSGDYQTILEVFGKSQNNNQLTIDESRLVRGLLESIEQDSNPRKENTARALANIAERIDVGTKKEIFQRVAGWAVSSDGIQDAVAIPQFQPFFREC